MDMILNTSAQKEFDVSLIDTIVPDDSYPIRKETHPRGRIVFMSGDSSRNISDDTDLSWLEWDCNEVYLSGNDKDLLFKKAISRSSAGATGIGD